MPVYAYTVSVSLGSGSPAPAPPPPEGDPAWLDGQSNLTWISLPNTDVVSAMTGYSTPPGVQGKEGSFAYTGMCVRRAESELAFGPNGGHLAYAGNEILSLKLQADSPAWSLRSLPSPTQNFGGSHNPDGKPASRHTYFDVEFDDASNKLFMLGAAATYGNGGDIYSDVDAFDFGTNTFAAQNVYPSIGAAQGGSVKSVAKDLNTGDIYIINEVNNTLYRWSRTRKTTTALTQPSGNVDIEYNTAMIHDPVRNRLIVFHTAPYYLDLNNSFTRTDVTFTGAGAAGGDYPNYAHYDELRDSALIMGRDSNTVYELNLTTFAITVLSISGTPPPAPMVGSNEEFNYLYGKWFRCPELGISGVLRHPNQNAFVFRTGTPPTLESDWAARSAGALIAERFNSAGSISPLQDGSQGDVVWEQTIKRSGSGAWRVNIPASRSTNVGSQFIPLPATRGNGTVTYYQVTYYNPQARLRYRPQYSNADAGGPKYFIISSAGASNTPNEVVLLNYRYQGYPQVYWQDGNSSAVFPGVGYSSPGNSSNFRLLPEVDNGVPQSISTDGDAELRYGPLYTSTFLSPTTPDPGDVYNAGYPNPNFVKAGVQMWEPDGWTTVLVRVEFGTMGTASSKIDLWACKPGFPYQHLVASTGVTLGDYGGGHEGIWLTPYDSDRLGNSPTVPDTFMVVAEVIASSNFIPAPKVR